MTQTLTPRQSRMLAKAATRGTAAPADPCDALRAAGWRAAEDDATGLVWQMPDGGDWYEFAFESAAELEAAAAIVARHPAIGPVALVERLPPSAPAAPAEQAPADDTPADALPLLELVAILDTYAEARPSPLPLDYLIARPEPLPERFHAPLGVVVPGRWQPRTVFDEAELQDLAASIREHGVLNPVLVFANERGQLELIGGERRLRASRLAGLRFIPVDVRSYTLRQIAEVSAIDNLQRADLTAVEEGAIFNRLIAELGVSEAELARRLGRSRGNIQQKRAIASADPAIHQAVSDGRIAFTIARTIIGAAPGDAGAQKKALKAVLDKMQYNTRVTEADAKKLADGVVFAGATKTLQKLGWSIHKFYDETVIWGGAERPAVWSGAAMLEAIQTGRRPSGAPALASAPSEATKKALALRGYRVSALADSAWFELREGWSGPRRFVSADELAAMVPTVKAEIAEMRAAYQAAGWELIPSENWIEAKHPDGAGRSLHDWGHVRSHLAEIQAGTVPTTREEPKATPSPEITCGQCSAKTRDWQWLGSTKVCRPCLHAAQAAERERREAISRRVAALLPTLTPGPAYEALALVSRWYSNKEDDGEAIGNFLYHTLTSQLSQERMDRTRVEALLPPDPGAPAAGEGPKPGSLEWVSAGVARIEAQIAGGRVDADAVKQLAQLDEALEALADVLDDVTYEGLSRRLSDATEALPEVA